MHVTIDKSHPFTILISVCYSILYTFIKRKEQAREYASLYKNNVSSLISFGEKGNTHLYIFSNKAFDYSLHRQHT
jgi:hypothetical protein